MLNYYLKVLVVEAEGGPSGPKIIGMFSNDMGLERLILVRNVLVFAANFYTRS